MWLSGATAVGHTVCYFQMWSISTGDFKGFQLKVGGLIQRPKDSETWSTTHHFLAQLFKNHCINVGPDYMCIRGSHEPMELEGMFTSGSLVDVISKKTSKSWSSPNVTKEKCKTPKIPAQAQA